MPSDIKLFNRDCMEAMKEMKDKEFDLAICDPPYGIGEDGGSYRGRNGSNHRILPKKGWDISAPDRFYFEQLERVSCNRILWGANHFCHELVGTSGWIFWNKLMGGDFSDGEIAYTSFDRALKMFTFCNKYYGKIHPTEKPPQLYKWLLKNYAKDGDKILDTHLGSGSIAIACYDMGYDLTGFEIDLEYYNAAVKRLENHKKQITFF
jgi:site-specific DNA-methyltransferase (adenine-specific)